MKEPIIIIIIIIRNKEINYILISHVSVHFNRPLNTPITFFVYIYMSPPLLDGWSDTARFPRELLMSPTL